MGNQGEVQTPVSSRPDRANQYPASTGWTRAEGVFAAIAVFVILGVTFGFVGIYKSIRRPFVPNVNALALANTGSGDDLAALKNQDTDEDGLSDYDELYSYGTSPYLADSDSDTVSDKEELESGNDPNCPTGQDCTDFGASLNANTNAPSSNTNAATNTAGSNGNVNTSTSVDLIELRQILKNSGAPAYIVDSTDDATLLQLYAETLAESGQTNANTNATNASTDLNVSLDSDTLASLKGLSAAEIRQLLIENGADESLLENASDEDLKTIFGQAIDQQLTNSSS